MSVTPFDLVTDCFRSDSLLANSNSCCFFRCLCAVEVMILTKKFMSMSHTNEFQIRGNESFHFFPCWTIEKECSKERLLIKKIKSKKKKKKKCIAHLRWMQELPWLLQKLRQEQELINTSPWPCATYQSWWAARRKIQGRNRVPKLTCSPLILGVGCCTQRW